MPIGIQNITTIHMDNLTNLANVSSFPEFLIKVNHIIYNGVFWFILLWVLWTIFYMVGQNVTNDPLKNAMYSGAIVSILSFILRAINMVILGVVRGLLTDWQMWVFPLITIIIAVIIWGTKD